MGVNRSYQNLHSILRERQGVLNSTLVVMILNWPSKDSSHNWYRKFVGTNFVWIDLESVTIGHWLQVQELSLSEAVPKQKWYVQWLEIAIKEQPISY